MSEDNVTRRRMLQGVGGGIAATTLVAGSSAAENDEYIVGIEPSTDTSDIRAVADAVRHELDFGRIGKAISGRFSENAIQTLENNPNVRYIEENGRMYALGQTTPYGIEKVDADVAIDDGETGDGVSVAILDTGIDAQHETLEENLGEGWAADGAECTTSCGGWGGGGNDIDECLEEWDDDNDHGSHCAGTAAAADNGEGVLGVAPNATLHAVKVLECDGGGSMDNIAAGIEWSADQGHEVISMSLGGDSDSDAVSDALEYAASQGSVLVAAAGNDGPCSDCVGFPARHEEVIAVSATDEDDDLADFSSTGPEVEIAAPGVDTLSTVPRDDYDEFSGTSMACPHVSGAAATLIASGVTNRDEVRDQLKEAADDIDLDDNEQGAGRLNVADALDIEDDDDGDDDDDDEDDGDDEKCVDAENWPAGTGSDGDENINEIDLDGQVVESSDANAYEDFTCPDVVTVEQGSSVEVAMDWSDGGYSDHYANVFVDWDQNEDWSTAQETVLLEGEGDDGSTATATVDVPGDAALGGTLLRVRLSYDGFDDADDTDEFGEVNDFTVYVEEGEEDDDDDDDDEPEEECVDAENWPAGTGRDGDENIDTIDVDGQVVESSGADAYEDFTCPDVVTVEQGGSFEVAMDWSDGGFDDHYANVFVDWDQNEDWSTAEEWALMEGENDDNVTATTTIEVPSDAELGATLCRIRLSYGGHDDPDDTDEFGEVNDVTLFVE